MNITSVGGRVAETDSLSREVEAFGVTVVKVTPGAVSTNLIESGLAAAARITNTVTADQHERYDELGRAFTAQAEGFDRDGVSRSTLPESSRKRWSHGGR